MLIVALFPRTLQPPDPRVDTTTLQFVGPMIDPRARIDAPFEPGGPGPVVYMSLGTLHRASTAFFRQCLEVFADLPARCVLATGGQVDVQALGSVPPNCVVRASVPQLAVLQHAAVFITHGGMNSVLEGLAYGVPLLVIPQHIEQLVIGLTVAERGAALVRRERVAGRRLAASALRRDVERMLGTPDFKKAASEMQTLLRATGGYAQAADAVQAYAKTG